MRAHDGAQNASFTATVVADRAHLDQDAIAVHCGADSVRRNEDVRGNARLEVRRSSREIRDDESEPIAMQAQLASNQILSRRSMRNRVVVRINLCEFAARDQLLQSPGELFARVSMQSKFAHQLLVTGGLLRLALDLLENDGVRKHA